MSDKECETLILWYGEDRLTKQEAKAFKRGDSIFGDNRSPKEVKRWPFAEKKAAYEELNRCACTYEKYGYGDSWSVKEYALEDVYCDEEGNILFSVGYDLASPSPEDAYGGMKL